MSKQKASFCDECVHFREFPLRNDGTTCVKGHEPRFYMPPREDAGISTRWGYMRVCSDFTKLKEAQ